MYQERSNDMTEQEKERQRQLIEIAKRNPQKLNLEPYKPKNSEWVDYGTRIMPGTRPPFDGMEYFDENGKRK